MHNSNKTYEYLLKITSPTKLNFKNSEYFLLDKNLNKEKKINVIEMNFGLSFHVHNPINNTFERKKNNSFHSRTEDKNKIIKKNNFSFFKYWKETKPFKFSIYDLAISGIFLAIFLGLSFLLKRTVFIRQLNIAFEIPFYIIFGLILGPVKGAFLAILADFFDILLKGGIATWTIYYAIVPPLVAILSWLFFYLFTKKSKWSLLFPLIILISAITAMLLLAILKEKPKIDQIDKGIKKYFTQELVITLASITFGIILLTLITMLILYLKTNKEIYKLIIFIISCIVTLLIIFRWIWGPIAFIDFYNRFINKSGKPDRLIQEYYWFYLTPIILKGVITIPIYCFILVPLIPLLLKLNIKHNKKAIKY